MMMFLYVYCDGTSEILSLEEHEAIYLHYGYLHKKNKGRL